MKEWEPLMFVLRELKRSLTASMEQWDPDNYTNGLAVVRMDGLIELVVQMNEKTHLHVDWVAISSFLFGTCMVHRVINNEVNPLNPISINFICLAKYRNIFRHLQGSNLAKTHGSKLTCTTLAKSVIGSDCMQF